MTAFMSFSHGTQDVYPTFLAVAMKLSPETIGLIGVLYGLVPSPAESSSVRSLKDGAANGRSSLRRCWRFP
jgi:hypothetical protein